jgi:hypothetical protein
VRGRRRPGGNMQWLSVADHKAKMRLDRRICTGR